MEQQRRRDEREAQRREKQAERDHAAAQAHQFDAYLDTLAKIHVECGEHWDWKSASLRSSPTEPTRLNHHETAAQAALDGYKPGLFERLFGAAKQKRLALERAVADGKATDAHKHETALRIYKERLSDWKTEVRISPGVLKLELDRCREALDYVGAFEALAELNTRATLSAVNKTVAILSCIIDDPEIVPKEELKLTSTGKLSSKDMAIGKYWTIYQDYVCSCSLRIARETFAALPVDRVIVSVRSVRLDTSTGHIGPATILAVSFTRDGLDRLNLAAIDPSDSLRNFPHKMTFKKTTGFGVVDEISEDDQWVST